MQIVASILSLMGESVSSLYQEKLTRSMFLSLKQVKLVAIDLFFSLGFDSHRAVRRGYSQVSALASFPAVLKGIWVPGFKARPFFSMQRSIPFLPAVGLAPLALLSRFCCLFTTTFSTVISIICLFDSSATCLTISTYCVCSCLYLLM